MNDDTPAPTTSSSSAPARSARTWPTAPAPAGLQHRDRGERTGRRRVLVLGLHAEQGAAAPGGRARRRAPRARAGRRRAGTAGRRGRPGPPRRASPRTGRTTARSTGWTRLGVDLVRGHGRLDRPAPGDGADPRRRHASRLTARHAVAVCTGTSAAAARPARPRHASGRGPAARPPAPGPVPGRLAVVGGGVVGRRDGHRLAGARLPGHPAGPRRRAAAADGAVRRRAGRRRRCARPGVDVRTGAVGRPP